MSNAKVRARRRRRAFTATPQPTRVVRTSWYDNHVAAWLCVQMDGNVDRALRRLDKLMKAGLVNGALKPAATPPFTKA